MEPLVSVIVPVYRVEGYLTSCLESIRAQTHKNLQIIVVDDGSPDGCPAICDAFAASDSRVQVIHQRNTGAAAARNVGLDFVEGEYISFVDSDDVVAPDFIQALLAASADIAQCEFCTDKTRLMTSVASHDFTTLTGKEANERLQLDGTGNYTVVWNKLYRASLWRDVRFPVGHYYEDEYVTYRLLWAAKTFRVTTAELYFYRQREGSLMNQGVSESSVDAIQALRSRADFYSAQGERRLAALTRCVELHRLQTIVPGLRPTAPDASDRLAGLARDVHREILGSPDVPLVKKIKLTLRMVKLVGMGGVRP